MERLASQNTKTHVQHFDGITGNSGVVPHNVSGNASVIGTATINNYSALPPGFFKTKRITFPSRQSKKKVELQQQRVDSGPASNSPPQAVLRNEEITELKISDYDPERTLWAVAHRKCPQTTQWILDDAKYLAWVSRKGNQCLWLNGSIGSGKTFLGSTIIEALQNSADTFEPELIAHFFFRFSYKSFLTANAIIDSFILQILEHLKRTDRQESVSSEVKRWIRRFYGPAPDIAYEEEIQQKILLPLCSVLRSATFVVDGLDYCKADEIQQVLRMIRAMLSAQPMVRVLIISRGNVDVSSAIDGSETISITLKNALPDIRLFIDWKIQEKMSERRITERESTLTTIKSRLIAKAEKMIWWVSLQIDAIFQAPSGDASILNALENLPDTLKETYEWCMKMMARGQLQLAVKALKWVCVAAKPFSALQLCQALAMDSENGTIVDHNLPTIQDIVRSCANLISESPDGIITLAHQSVNQFLLDASHSTATLFPHGWLGVAHHDLGLLCIRHLSSSDSTVAVIPLNINTATRKHLEPVIPPMINSLFSDQTIARWLPSKRLASLKTPTIDTRSRYKSASISSPPSFFNFACGQWVESCRHFSYESLNKLDQQRLQRLVLDPSLRMEIQPWRAASDLLESNEVALLCWSILTHHESFFTLLMGSPNREQIPPGYLGQCLAPIGGLNLLQLAARSGNSLFYNELLAYASLIDIMGEDTSRHDLLWHAVDVQNDVLVRKLVKRISEFKSAKDDTSALALAIDQGYYVLLEEVSRTIEPGTFGLYESMIHTALHQQRIEVLDWLLQKGISGPTNTIFKSIELDGDLLLSGVKSGHNSTIAIVLDNLQHFSPLTRAVWMEIALLAIDGVLPSSYVLQICSKIGFDNFAYYDICLAVLSTDSISLAKGLLDLLRSKDRSDSTGIVGRLYHHFALHGDLEKLQKSHQAGIASLLDQASIHYAFYVAILQGQPEVVAHMVDLEYVEVDSVFSPNGSIASPRSVLWYAFESGNIEVIKVLLERHARPIVQFWDDRTGTHQWTTALHRAASKNMVNAAKLFLDQKDEVDLQGDTALMVAVRACSWECADLLIKHGNSLQVPDDTVGFRKHYSRKHLLVLEVLRTAQESMPFHWSRFRAWIEQRVAGRTLLHEAIMHNDIELITWLVKFGANVDALWMSGSQEHAAHLTYPRPLHLAVGFQRLDAIDILLSREDVIMDAKNSRGQTALELAKFLRYDEAVSRLSKFLE